MKGQSWRRAMRAIRTWALTASEDQHDVGTVLVRHLWTEIGKHKVPEPVGCGALSDGEKDGEEGRRSRV